MKEIKKILIALDNSDMDKTLIEYSNFLAQMMPIKKIYFLNIIKNISIPDDVLAEFPTMKKDAVEGRKKDLKKEVKKYSEYPEDVKTKFIVSESHISKSILKESEKHSIDLILVGRKVTIHSSGVTLPRIARRANRNLLIIPEDSKPGTSKFLVPIDFSNHSELALRSAITVARETDPPAEIICQNVYSVPVGYHYTGKSYDDFAEIMKKHSEKDYQKFVKDIDFKNVKVSPVYNLDKNDDLTSDIIDFGNKIKPDWIFIGAKGRSSTAALFIGSFAEKLIGLVKNTPIFIAREKGKSSGLFDYLKEL